MNRMLKIALVDALALGLIAALPGMPLAEAAAPATCAQAAPQVISVSGTVADSAGKPVAGAIVLVRHHHCQQGGGTAPATQPSHRQFIRTDANGNFTLPHVHVGATIIAFKRGSGVGTATVQTGTVTITLTVRHKQ